MLFRRLPIAVLMLAAVTAATPTFLALASPMAKPELPQHLLPNSYLGSTSLEGIEIDVADGSFRLEPSPLDQLLPDSGPDGRAELADNLSSLKGELYERQRVGDFARSLLVPDAGKLKKLEEVLGGYRNSDERTPSGTAKLSIAHRKFDGAARDEFRNRAIIDYVLKAIEVWRTATPKSPFAPVFEAQMHKNIAIFSMLSTRFEKEKSWGIDDPGTHLENARKILEAAAEARDLNPHWHALYLEIRAMQSALVEDLFKYVEEGSRKFPNYIAQYIAMAEALFDVSKNAARDIEAVAVAAGERGAAEGKNAQYARIYMSLFFSRGPSVLENLKMNNYRFASGAMELIDKFPDEFNSQRMAAMACAVDDKRTARAMLGPAESRPVLSIWGQPEFYKRCRDWALAEREFERDDLRQREIEN